LGVETHRRLKRTLSGCVHPAGFVAFANLSGNNGFYFFFSNASSPSRALKFLWQGWRVAVPKLWIGDMPTLPILFFLKD
jgi:hypothetical protein